MEAIRTLRATVELPLADHSQLILRNPAAVEESLFELPLSRSLPCVFYLVLFCMHWEYIPE